MNGLKSINMLFRACIVITFVFFLITIVISKKVGSKDKRKEVIEDLPKADDLDLYLNGVEKAVDFCIRHKIYVDLNLEFGLFLIDVNIKKNLQEKRINIPPRTRFRLEQLLMKNEVLADYFHYMVHKTRNIKEYDQDRALSELFYNKTTWPKTSDKFNIELLKQTKIYSAAQLEKIYGKWETYYTNVYDFHKYKPSPEESDRCIENLSRISPIRPNRRSLPNCLTLPRCKIGVKEGSEFGYGLSHRILFLVVARFSRGCTVFSEEEDKNKADKYCMRSFNEAQYIASNNYLLPDLMFEQITLCGLFGHAQFIHNTWLKSLLQFQTSEGCFSDNIVTGSFKEPELKEPTDEEWTIANRMSIMNGQCNGHFTAVAAGALSHAVRYILETYY